MDFFFLWDLYEYFGFVWFCCPDLADEWSCDLRSCNISSPERRSPSLRAVFHETTLSLANFVYPLFINDGQDDTPIWAMLGCLGLGGDVDLWKSYRGHHFLGFHLKGKYCIRMNSALLLRN
ncbi:uncharacterized protein LOC126582503 [Malus sylvestris]|uniref:uncharacterized protein LOC126582503 n=1 Tax=Malus sylvestris TaxID=3752 RepID=UPI0021AC7AC1|nr:uncharacterized protein LOC126582503 [Malus sylvestris]